MSSKTAPFIRRPYTYVLSASPEFLTAALRELQLVDPSLHQIMEPSNEIAVIESTLDVETLHDAIHRNPPIFLRHIAPAQGRVILTGHGNDLGDIAREAMGIPEVRALRPGDTFSVQARVVTFEEQELPYSPYAVRSAIARLIKVETGAREHVRRPELVISILALPTIGFVGISSVDFNLSDWAGGARRFARADDTLTQSAYRLIEALEIFGLEPPEGGHALDLGASPGGWSRELLARGMQVTAVDARPLDPSVSRDPGIRIVEDRVGSWLREQTAGARYDLISADLPVTREEAPPLVDALIPLLAPDGCLLISLQIHHEEFDDREIQALQAQLAAWRARYRDARARQLYNGPSGELMLFVRV